VGRELRLAGQIAPVGESNAVVEKQIGVHVKGLRLSLERLEGALGEGRAQADEVYIYTTEFLTWLAIVAEARVIGDDPDVKALMFARNRSHHSRASVTVWIEDREAFVWRPASQLRRDPGYRTGPREEERERLYIERLADQPVIDALRRVAQAISPETLSVRDS
jgi:hypothetical protein